MQKSMRIHIICPVFPPESVASAVMAQHIAQGLVRSNHRVAVITSFPSKMKGELYPGYKRTLMNTSIHEDGFTLCRVFSFVSRKSNVISRLVENISFAIASNLASMLLGKPDVVYMNTWPVVATFVTGAICRLRGLRYVYNVQDLYPESARGLGHIADGGLFYRLMLHMDRFTAYHASHIVAISEEFADVIHRTRNVPRGKISVVWNWYDARVFPEEKWGWFRQSIAPASNSNVIMYAGNIGSVAGLEVVIEAAERIAERGNFLFVLAGEGVLRERLEGECRKRSISNILFVYPLHREDLSRIQAAADVMLITTKRGLSLSEVPSKLMGYMLSGRPVLAMVDRESNTARLIERAKCGMVGPPENPAALADLAESMVQSGRLEEWGKNAREFAEAHFDQEQGVHKIMGTIEAAIQREDLAAGR